MSPDHAAKLVKRLLGSYASLNLHDPETYITAIVSLFCGYPDWAGEQAVEYVTRTSKFPPARAELHADLESRVKSHRYAAQWERQAERQALPAPAMSKQQAEDLAKKMGELAKALREKAEKERGELEAKKADRMLETGREFIQREYDVQGREAVRSCGILISHSLVKSVRTMLDDSAK